MRLCPTCGYKAVPVQVFDLIHHRAWQKCQRCGALIPKESDAD